MNHDHDKQKHEWVLLVPPKLTKSSFEILKKANCVARPWHLAGRHGSRTHAHSEGKMAIPILSRDKVWTESKVCDELQSLLETDGVEIVWKERYISKRHTQPPRLDATIHAERAPPNYKIPTRAETKCSSSIYYNLDSFTFAELFAGIGGFGVALEALGGTCVFVSELEASCRQIYQANLNIDPNNVHGDIYNVLDSRFPTNVDLLVAGFPCQPFSSLGLQPGLECAKGNLFREIVRFLQVAQPKAFLLENVPGLLGMKDTLDVILEALKDCGYHTFHEILDARGVTATTRKRLYIIGLRTNIEGSSSFDFPFIPDLSLRARDVIDFDANDDNNLLLRITDKQLDRLIGSKHWKPVHLAWPNTTIKTLVSHYGNSIARGDSQLVPCITGNPRRFSVRECASLMGFPRSFQLPFQPQEHQGDMAFLKQQYRMFGNAVCPPMIAVLAGAVLDKAIDNVSNGGSVDWVETGRETSVRLAYNATLSEK